MKTFLFDIIHRKQAAYCDDGCRYFTTWHFMYPLMAFHVHLAWVYEAKAKSTSMRLIHGWGLHFVIRSWSDSDSDSIGSVQSVHDLATRVLYMVQLILRKWLYMPWGGDCICHGVIERPCLMLSGIRSQGSQTIPTDWSWCDVPDKLYCLW